MKDWTIILDPGHGIGSGHKTPDGCNFGIEEYVYTRKLVTRLRDYFQDKGIKCVSTVTGNENLSLPERLALINSFDPKKTLLVSVHNSGNLDNTWDTEKNGWSCVIPLSATEEEKRLSEIFKEYAQGERFRLYQEGIENLNLYLLSESKCHSIQTQNFFLTHPWDIDFLYGSGSLGKLSNLHIRSILKFLEE